MTTVIRNLIKVTTVYLVHVCSWFRNMEGDGKVKYLCQSMVDVETEASNSCVALFNTFTGIC